MAENRKQSRAAANKRKGRGSPQTRVAALERRVAALGAELRAPFHVRRHAAALGTTDAFRDPAVALTEVRQIEFDKSDDSPSLVRITLDGFEEVVRPGGKRGISRPRPVGSFVNALIEVIGNPGQTATIAVRNASPPSIQITIPQGRNQTFGTKPLLVV